MYIEQFGQGPDLVMLHGWSMHSGVWHTLAEQLSQSYTVHLVDLPGHGRSGWTDESLEINQLVETLAQRVPDSAVWIGWSLGGLISLYLADKYPSKIKKLVLLAATPLFVQAEDWTCAMPNDVFEQFAENLESDQTQTIKRFLMLQARGSDQSRQTIRILSEQLATEHSPHPDALKAGLELLLNLDARQQLAAITCPLMLLLGDKDSLIPASLPEQVSKLNAQCTFGVIRGAGHAPFISHPDQSYQHIEQFLHG